MGLQCSNCARTLHIRAPSWGNMWREHVSSSKPLLRAAFPAAPSFIIATRSNDTPQPQGGERQKTVPKLTAARPTSWVPTRRPFSTGVLWHWDRSRPAAGAQCRANAKLNVSRPLIVMMLARRVLWCLYGPYNMHRHYSCT